MTLTQRIIDVLAVGAQMKRAEIAAALGVHASNLSRCSRGSQDLSLRQLQRLARHLGTSAAEIVRRAELGAHRRDAPKET